ncbi:two-component system, sensor histidine kinase YesM [Fictibacillus solisalsi]|uniref:Two-component system, sensor histidine kinase YesM n=1 Tax=Fictibacillus solisalsi TaxID=459525 RepID=A0A1G9YGN1_9BACL|nr:sensor histidine kinase [Fictibacillus solisalsi]SDN08160.1 two-component system, sensor histidine kinase YesM [Fictibacillus solisalsi]
MKKRPRRRFTQDIFNRIFFISSLTIIVTVIFLIVTITNYYSDVLIQKEVNINTRTLERVEDYFSTKEADIERTKRDLYTKGEVLEDVTFALHNGYEKYLEYRLDKFSESHSVIPNNINTYFNAYFGQDDDINAIRLRSTEKPMIEYKLIYNRLRWDQSILEKPVDSGSLPSEELPRIQSKNQEKNQNYKDTIIKKIVINNPGTLKKMGEISIFYSTNRLDKIVQKHDGTPTSFFLMDADGSIIYSVNKAHVPLDMINKIKPETNETKIKWNHSHFYINTIANKGDYTYISVIPDRGWQKLSIVRWSMWVVIIIFLTISILITYSFTHNYSRRINQIITIIRQVEKGNLNARIPLSKREDELSKIAVNINSMLDELNNYIEEFYLLNLQQQQAELRALQAQIDPHFLFNTLEAIRMVAVMEGSKTSGEMIFHLSKLFRYTLEAKDTVPLYTEMEYVNQYLILMQYKYPNKLRVHLDIPDDVENTLVQKLILQPIIENYFVHGFKKGRSDNELSIYAAHHGDKIEICVKDNGKGMTEEELAKILQYINGEEGEEMRSIGLRNIHQRLKLKYGPSSWLSVQSTKDKGTIVTLLIPLKGNSHV